MAVLTLLIALGTLFTFLYRGRPYLAWVGALAVLFGGWALSGAAPVLFWILLVPTALSAVGTQLFKSMELRNTTASTKYPVNNPHQGKFRVEVSRYLSNSQYTGNSAKAWYLLADPNDLPVNEVAFLNGQESPTIETADADFHVLGIQLRGFHDFGSALIESRAGIKSAGE